ncbi:Bug family tripartite tricarboxylate transporter substrate binding protein [Rhodovarius lipocyclicus]|uniref:Bug family tripartite tricarboxylate transporter substrate binding protein n=1 Tax=Rhodovarius lipocyclicus TaxID=268410 RepID=UPI00135ABF3C|nr:tripartite tricarboxylate transporter substrate binding protein [Rhodovarius lipocyclicus]
MPDPTLWALRRRTLLASSVAGLSMPGLSRAQGPWPSRPIRFVVPLGPGGATDIVMRIIAPKLGEILGTTCVVENRVGAGGVVGTDHIAKSAPDGYSFIHASVSTIAIAPFLYERLPYDPQTDLTPIAPSVFVPLCLSVTTKNLNVTSLQGLIEEMRARPGQLSFASNGTGATSHLAGANLLRLTGCRAEHVPYRSGAEAINALVAGDVQFAFDIAALHGPQARDGRIRIIMATPDRQPLIPDVPSNTEAGLPDLKAYAWFGFFGPAGLPPEMVTRLNAAINEAMAEPAIKARLEQSGMPPMLGYTPDRFGAFIREEREFWPPIIRASGARVQ